MTALPSKKIKLAGWGNVPTAICRCLRPEKIRELDEALRQSHTLLARGAGKAYGDAALNPETVVLTERLDRFITFDSGTGTVQAQAGVTLAQLMDVAIGRGFLPPVIPGTKYVTLGGALACNVHGKNQYRDGEFAEHVTAFTLRLANGERVTCTPHATPELFWATAGGMGMTGIIEEVTLRLRPIASASLRAEQQRVRSVPQMVEAFRKHADSADYMVGWIDHFVRGKELGRGIFEQANHITVTEGGRSLAFPSPKHPRRHVPFTMPGFLLNRYSMALYNWLRWRKLADKPHAATCDFDGFFHPLDGIAHWNRLYGKRGFFQYQCIVPDSPEVASHLQSLLQLLQRKKIFSFLAVMKYHRGTAAMLGFSRDGFSLALDFPNTPRVRAALPEIDRYVASCGGRVYLAKDATLSPASFEAMYGPSLPAWREAVRHFDPESRFDSLLARRIGLKGER